MKERHACPWYYCAVEILSFIIIIGIGIIIIIIMIMDDKGLQQKLTSLGELMYT